MRTKKDIRFYAWVTLLFFVFTDIVRGAPDPALLMQPAAFWEAGKSIPVIDVLSGLPEHAGRVKTVHALGQTTPPDFAVHIQDAHANPDAQESIHAIITFLHSAFNGYEIHLGVEGAAGRLYPEYFDFFPDYPEAGEAVVRRLLANGEISGAELFAWKHYSNREKSSTAALRISGAENLDIYAENLRGFRELLKNRGAIERQLSEIYTGLMTDGSKILNAELINFLKEKEKLKDGVYGGAARSESGSLEAYIDYLSAEAKKHIGVDLYDPVEQLRFPNLVRMRALTLGGGKLSEENVRKEWRDVLRELSLKADQEDLQTLDFLQRTGISNGYLDKQTAVSVDSGPSSPRLILEKTLALIKKRGLSAEYKDFKASWRALVLRDEIDAVNLFDEIKLLEDSVIHRLCRSDEEKEWLKNKEALTLLEKLLRAEMTTSEYIGFQSAGGDLDKRIKALHAYSPAPAVLDSYYEKALAFYKGAKQRDRELTGWIRESIKAAQPEEPRSGMQRRKLYIILSGGFHSQGIENELRALNVPYAVIQPHIQSTDGGDLYRRVMSGSNADLSAYFGAANPFSTRQEAVFFKELTETAIPVLLEHYNLPAEKVFEMVRNVFSSHPVLSQAEAKITADENSFSLEVFPAARGGPSAENAAIAGELHSASPGFNRRVAQIARIDHANPSMFRPHRIQVGDAAKRAAGRRGAEAALRDPGQEGRSELRMPYRDSPVPPEDPFQRKKYFVSRLLADKLKVDKLEEDKLKGDKLEQDKKLEEAKRFNRFYEAFWGILPWGYVVSDDATPESLSYAVTRMYKLFNEYVEARNAAPLGDAKDSNQIRSDVFTVDAELISRYRLPPQLLGQTFIYIVGFNRAGYAAKWDSVIAAAGGNIKTGYTTTFFGRRLEEEVFIAMLNVTKDGEAFTPSELEGMQNAIDDLGRKKNEENLEVRIEGVSNARDQVMLGKIGVLRALTGSIPEVAYDILSRLRSTSDLHDPGRVNQVIEEDIISFTESFGRAAARVESDNLLSPPALNFIRQIQAKVLEEARRPLVNRTSYRASALSLFLSLTQKAFTENSHDLSDQDIEAIKNEILKTLSAVYISENAEAEAASFEAALEKVLTENQQADTTDRLAGMRGLIKTIGIEIAQKIRSEGITAPRAIDLVVEKAIESMKTAKGKSLDLRYDIERTYAHILRMLRNEPLQEELLGDLTSDKLMFLARHLDPHRLMNLKAQFQTLFPENEPPRIRFFVTDEGTLVSHAALWAANQGISSLIINPARNLIDFEDESLAGKDVIIDGSRGLLIINPSEETKRIYREIAEAEEAYARVANRRADEDAVTAFGRKVKVVATADSTEEVAAAEASGAEGTGLVRTEYLFSEDNEALMQYLAEPSAGNRFLLIEYFKQEFVKMAREANGKPIKIRTFDLEDDKIRILPNPSQDYGPEYYRTNFGREMLRIQIEAAALAYLDAPNIELMFPMNRTPQELAKRLGRKNLENISARDQRKLDALAKDDVDSINQLFQDVISQVPRYFSSPDRSLAAEAEKKLEGFKRHFVIETVEMHGIRDYVLDHSDGISYGTTDLTISLFRNHRKSKFKITIFWRSIFGYLQPFIGTRRASSVPAYLIHAYQQVKRSLAQLREWSLKHVIGYKFLEKIASRSLTQVTGVSRNNADDQKFFNEVQDEVMRIMQEGSESVARKNQEWREKGIAKEATLSVCGGLAGEPAFALAMSGIEGALVELSVPAQRIPLTKHLLRGVEEADLRDIQTESGLPLHARLAAKVTEIRNRQMETTEVKGALADVKGGVPEKQDGAEEEDYSYVRRTYKLGPLGMHSMPGMSVAKVMSAYPSVQGIMISRGRRLDLRLGFTLGTFLIMNDEEVEIELTGEGAAKALRELEAITESDMPEELVFNPASEPVFEPQPQPDPEIVRSYKIGALGLHPAFGTKAFNILSGQAYKEVVAVIQSESGIYSLRLGAAIPQILPGETIQILASGEKAGEAIAQIEEIKEENEPHKGKPILLKNEADEPAEEAPTRGIYKIGSSKGLNAEALEGISRLLIREEHISVMAILKKGNKQYDLRSGSALGPLNVAGPGDLVELHFSGANASDALSEIERAMGEDEEEQVLLFLPAEEGLTEAAQGAAPSLARSYKLGPLGVHPEMGIAVMNILNKTEYLETAAVLKSGNRAFSLRLGSQLILTGFRAGDEVEIELSGPNAEKAFEELEALKETAEFFEGSKIFRPSEERSELRNGEPPFNPYGDEGQVNRGFSELDMMHDGRISASIDRRISEGARPKILLIGIGRGIVAYDLIRRYGDKVEIYSLSIEDLLHTPESLVNQVNNEISLEEAGHILGIIKQHYTIADMEESFGDFEGDAFDIAVSTQTVMQYIQNRPAAIERLRSKLVQGGELFADLDIFSIRNESGDKIDTKAFFEGLGPDYKVYGLGPSGKMAPYSFYPVLHITNDHPEQSEIPLDPLPDRTNAAKLRPAPEQRSELRSGDELSVNPYTHEGNVNRDLDGLDQLHKGRITAALDRRISGGERPKVLLLGIGRGMVPYDLIRRYSDKVELYSLALEDLLHTPKSLVSQVENAVTEEEAARILGIIKSHYTLANIEKSYGDFEHEMFDMIISTQTLMEYIHDRAALVDRLRSKLVPGGELFTDLDVFKIFDASGARLNNKAFFEGFSPDFFVDGIGPAETNEITLGMPMLHFTKNDLNLGPLPLDRKSNSTYTLRTPENERSELRIDAPQLSSSAAFRSVLSRLGKEERPEYEGLEPFAAGIDEAARELSRIYSPDAVSAYLPGRSKPIAEQWIVQRLAEIIVRAEESRVVNKQLQDMAEDLMGVSLKSRDAYALDKGPAVHVDLARVPEDPVSFVPILAVLADFGGELHLNVSGIDENAAAKLQDVILTAGKNQGVELRKGRFSVNPSGAGRFGTVPQHRFTAGESHGLLGELGSVTNYPRRQGIHLFKMNPEALLRAEILAAYIVTVIRAMALDKQLGDTSEVLDPEKMAPDAFSQIVQIIGNYLETQARISASA